jgi:2-oxoacid dehydrogenases acyltransferase (catalytic domain)
MEGSLVPCTVHLSSIYRSRLFWVRRVPCFYKYGRSFLILTGMHAIKEKPVVVNGEIVIRPIMVVALTYDHRLLDGREAVTFLGKFISRVFGFWS